MDTDTDTINVSSLYNTDHKSVVDWEDGNVEQPGRHPLSSELSSEAGTGIL